MADYIGRKDVKELLLRLKAAATRIDDPGINTVFAMRGFVDEVGAYEIVERLVEKLPSVDAVSVVRCKDCAHYREHPFGEGKVCMNHEYFLYTDSNDFCSDGERRE